MSEITTPKGKKLPLSNLKGKDYLEVKWRLVWFREDHPTWGIETEIQSASKAALAKATIKDDQGRIIATAHKFEDEAGFKDYREKAETGAIGRALGFIGYGAQFSPELEEGDRIVDSPTPRRQVATTGFITTNSAPAMPGKAIQFGKFKGLTFPQVPDKELENYAAYLMQQKEQSNMVKQFIVDVQKHLAAKREQAVSESQDFTPPANDDVPF